MGTRWLNLTASIIRSREGSSRQARRTRTRGSGSKGRLLRWRRLRVRPVHRPGEQKHQERRDGAQQSWNRKNEHHVNVGAKSLIPTSRSLGLVATPQRYGYAPQQEKMRHKQQKAGNPSPASDLPPRSGSDIKQRAERENNHAYHQQHNPLHPGTIRSPRIARQDVFVPISLDAKLHRW